MWAERRSSVKRLERVSVPSATLIPVTLRGGGGQVTGLLACAAAASSLADAAAVLETRADGMRDVLARGGLAADADGFDAKSDACLSAWMREMMARKCCTLSCG
jgi:hypothetical protein